MNRTMLATGLRHVRACAGTVGGCHPHQHAGDAFGLLIVFVVGAIVVEYRRKKKGG